MFNVRDQIEVYDGSWSFGIVDGKISSLTFTKDKAPYTVVNTGLNVMRHSEGTRKGIFEEKCDLLVKDKEGNFWFVQSRLSEKYVETHPIIIDGKTINISEESYQSLKKALLK